MEEKIIQKLELKPAQSAPGPEDIVLQMTDIQLHTNTRTTNEIGKFFKRLIFWKKPARLYSPLPPQEKNKEGIINFNIDMGLNDPVLQETINECRKQGRRVLISVPNNVPILLGKDAVEFKNSVKGKRILRRLAKNES
ncbi:MAG: hypothetical protein PHE24_01230 [Patescibacteria group bacterium]|nr:hypothetical protein [Patescibacteria group bacterium]